MEITCLCKFLSSCIPKSPFKAYIVELIARSLHPNEEFSDGLWNDFDGLFPEFLDTFCESEFYYPAFDDSNAQFPFFCFYSNDCVLGSQDVLECAENLESPNDSEVETIETNFHLQDSLETTSVLDCVEFCIQSDSQSISSESVPQSENSVAEIGTKTAPQQLFRDKKRKRQSESESQIASLLYKIGALEIYAKTLKLQNEQLLNTIKSPQESFRNFIFTAFPGKEYLKEDVPISDPLYYIRLQAKEIMNSLHSAVSRIRGGFGKGFSEVLEGYKGLIEVEDTIHGLGKILDFE